MKNELALSGETIEMTIYPEDFEHIGMIRGEYLIREVNKNILMSETQSHILDYLNRVCMLYSKERVWYRFSELTISEANVLEGTKEVLADNHPLFGMRGLRRLLHYKDEFVAEVQTIVSVAKTHQNLDVFFPFVNDSTQLKQAIDIVRENHFTGDIGCMIELPSAYFDLDKILQTDITKIVIGMNDLTSFIFATVRESYWHQMESRIMQNIIFDIVDKARQMKIEVAVAGYLTPSFVEAMNHKGIQCIIHYHQIPEILNKEVTYGNHLNEIKQQTKRHIQKKLGNKKDKV